jgi:hypothetical protein
MRVDPARATSCAQYSGGSLFLQYGSKSRNRRLIVTETPEAAIQSNGNLEAVDAR